MEGEQAIFAVAGAVCVVGAANAVFRRDPLAATVSLIVTLVALAVLYLGLGYEVLAMIQVAVYAGAIMALFVIVVMLLGAPRAGEALRGPRLRVVGPAVALALFAILALAIAGGRAAARREGGPPGDELGAIADALYVRYAFPFEVASVLLLAALVAAVVLARKRSSEREWPEV